MTIIPEGADFIKQDSPKKMAEPSSYVKKRRTPLLAKLGIFTFVSLSLGGTFGFLRTTLTKQSAQFLSLALSSALSAAFLVGWTIKYNGVITLLPPEVETPLIQWDVIETVRYLNSTFDIDAAHRLIKELAPLALAKRGEETERAVRNMSSHWQRILTTKGLLGLLPPHTQRMLLPHGSPVILPPPHLAQPRDADLNNQVSLFRELAWLRIIELRDDMASRSKVVYFVKIGGDMAGKLYGFVKQNTSSDVQVAVIMSVLVILLFRVLLMMVLISLRRVVSFIYW